MSGQLPVTFVEGFHNVEKLKCMKYKQLGKTGLEVSQVAFGGGALCSKYGFDLEEGIKTVQEAIKAGINYIDTAPWYGQGRSEEVLGLALKDVPRKAYYIATKVGRYELDYQNMFDFSGQKARESVEKSLKLLGLEYIDVIQIHDIEFAPSMDILLNETLPVLEQLVKEGKANFIGVSGYPLSAVKNLVSSTPGRIDMVLSYSRYTLSDNTLLDYMDYFLSQNLGIVCAAAHAMGLLTNAGPQPWHPATNDQKHQACQAAKFCQDQGVELGKLALYHTIQLSGATTFLIGMQTRSLLAMNLDVFYNGLNGKEQEVLQHLYKTTFIRPFNWEGIELERYWAAIKGSLDE
ncbi:L-galactose dehydrogenase isoform X2 [Drosophila busckii]|uniref:L-galactose dehydrogenase isoform X2 n=1 Tax=Drosophila busckii TaxID=30019 RepID=UPI001433329C|nr:L-galactose dehydrogenase isoform X2 [Drosophila busckii]